MIAQAWIPIFVEDDLDTELLLEACQLADLKCLEYTLRRRDASQAVKVLKKRFPETVVLMGSTIDCDDIVTERKRYFPQLMTLSELAPWVDGFVSMLPFENETLQDYRKTHLCIPAAESGGDALRQIRNGAAIIKVLGPDFSLVKRLHALPTFQYCPTYVTGGITKERLAEAYQAGNLLSASGFDVVLKGADAREITANFVARKLSEFVSLAVEERDKAFPSLKNSETMTDEEFCRALPNFCSLSL